MENKIKEMKVAMPSILGSTTINHAARIQLMLNASEYVLMDYIYRCIQHKREMEVSETYRQTGFTTEQQQILLRSLVMKGFVFPDQVSPPKITSKWESAFADLKAEFDNLFWRKDGKAFFPNSSNKRSFGFYNTVRKKYPKDFLIKQRNHYDDYLKMQAATGFNQAKMMAERWLNPKNENYLIDWKQLADDIKEKIRNGEERVKQGNEKMEKIESVSTKDRRSQYEEDNKQ
jgi:hypothetical protein